MFDQIIEIWFVRFSFVLWTVFDTSFERSRFWIGPMVVIQTSFAMLKAKGVYILSSLRAHPYGVCVCVCVRACVRVCACVRVWLPPPPPFSLSIFFLRFALHRVRSLSFAPHPLPREKLEACIEHFECMIVNITVKTNVMFQINFCAARPAISPGKHLFLFFFLHPPFPPIILCLRYSLLDYIDLYIMYFPCVFAVFVLFCYFLYIFCFVILTATVTVYITTCILKNGFNFMRRLRVPVPAICICLASEEYWHRRDF